MVGSDAGFAVTPYGEWHARELEHLVRYLGFSPEEAMRCTTKVNAEAGLLRDGARTGTLQAGRHADFIVVDGDPLQDIEILQDKSRLKAIYLGGQKVELALESEREAPALGVLVSNVERSLHSTNSQRVDAAQAATGSMRSAWRINRKAL